jgi:hypothetical protein
MIAASGTPSGRTPWINAFLMSAVLQLPMPVSLSGVMLDAVTAKPGVSQDNPPE